MLHTAVLPDGQVRVCLTENDVTACCYVSSFHLVDEKEAQLQAAIKRTIAQRHDGHSLKG